MFEIECKNPDEIVLTTKAVTAKFDLATGVVDAGLAVGPLSGPGEYELGDIAVRAIATGEGENAKTVYDVLVGNVRIGIIGGIEEAVTLDELGVADVLCTSSVRAVREIDPKVVIAMGNVDGMVSELKLTPRAEKKFKLKNREALPATIDVVALT